MDNNKLVPTDLGANKENQGEEKKSSGVQRFFGFVKRNPLLSTIVFALLLLAGLYGYMSFQMNRMEKAHAKELIETTSTLNLDHIRNNARVFSWAIRSELIRGNKEQVEQFFINYLQLRFEKANLNVRKVFLIDPETQSIVISTDRKDLDRLIDDSKILNASSLIVEESEIGITVYNPVKGLDKTIGIVVVEFEK